jgi:hypothetical protein
MCRVAGKIVNAFGGRGAGLGRARLAHHLPPVVAVGLVSSVSPRGERERWGGPALRHDARHGEVEGLLRTTTRRPHGARLTFRLDAHIAARTRFVVEYSKTIV